MISSVVTGECVESVKLGCKLVSFPRAIQASFRIQLKCTLKPWAWEYGKFDAQISSLNVDFRSLPLKLRAPNYICSLCEMGKKQLRPDITIKSYLSWFKRKFTKAEYRTENRNIVYSFAILFTLIPSFNLHYSRHQNKCESFVRISYHVSNRHENSSVHSECHWKYERINERKVLIDKNKLYSNWGLWCYFASKIYWIEIFMRNNIRLMLRMTWITGSDVVENLWIMEIIPFFRIDDTKWIQRDFTFCRNPSRASFRFTAENVDFMKVSKWIRFASLSQTTKRIQNTHNEHRENSQIRGIKS